jgi:predicted membrane protein (TIGR00267 family)
VVLLPFFFSALLADVLLSYYASLAMALVVLFALGAFLGKVSKQNLIVSGAKMIGAGVVSILLSYFLGVDS